MQGDNALLKPVRTSCVHIPCRQAKSAISTYGKGEEEEEGGEDGGALESHPHRRLHIFFYLFFDRLYMMLEVHE